MESTNDYVQSKTTYMRLRLATYARTEQTTRTGATLITSIEWHIYDESADNHETANQNFDELEKLYKEQRRNRVLEEIKKRKRQRQAEEYDGDYPPTYPA